MANTQRRQENLPELAHNIRELIGPDAYRVYGDEEGGQLTGRGATFRLGPNTLSTIQTVLYSRNRRRYMARELAPIIGEHDAALGHVYFKTGQDTFKAELEGVIYALRGMNFIRATMVHDVEEPLSRHGQRSFDLARAVGIGDEWTDSVFAAEWNEAPPKRSLQRPLDEAESVRLNQTLRELAQKSSQNTP